MAQKPSAISKFRKKNSISEENSPRSVLFIRKIREQGRKINANLLNCLITARWEYILRIKITITFFATANENGSSVEKLRLILLSFIQSSDGILWLKAIKRFHISFKHVGQFAWILLALFSRKFTFNRNIPTYPRTALRIFLRVICRIWFEAANRRRGDKVKGKK